METVELRAKGSVFEIDECDIKPARWSVGLFLVYQMIKVVRKYAKDRYL